MSAKVQRAQAAFDKAQKWQIRLAHYTETSTTHLQEAANVLADAEHERTVLFKAMLPQLQVTPTPSTAPPTIDLSAMLNTQVLKESMFSLHLGAEFDNSDGVMDQSGMGEVESRRAAVKKA